MQTKIKGLFVRNFVWNDKIYTYFLELSNVVVAF